MTAISQDRPANTSLVQRGIREALYAGAISFGMFFLLIGIKTDQNIRNELILVPRWGLLAVVIALVMAGRFLMVVWLHEGQGEIVRNEPVAQRDQADEQPYGDLAGARGNAAQLAILGADRISDQHRDCLADAEREAEQEQGILGDDLLRSEGCRAEPAHHQRAHHDRPEFCRHLQSDRQSHAGNLPECCGIEPGKIAEKAEGTQIGVAQHERDQDDGRDEAAHAEGPAEAGQTQLWNWADAEDQQIGKAEDQHEIDECEMHHHPAALETDQHLRQRHRYQQRDDPEGDAVKEALHE